MTYTYGEGEADKAETKDLVIIDGMFETPFHMIMSMTSNALNLHDDGTFDVSIMQQAAAIMHVRGNQSGTYTVNGTDIVFTEDFVSNGTDLTETGLSVGFNIAQSSMAASPAPFIKVN